MTAMPVLWLLVAAVTLGVTLLVFYIKGIRKPVVIGVHLLFALGALEQLVILLHGAPVGSVIVAGPRGNLAAGLIAAAAFSGLVGGVIAKNGRQTANIAVATHATLGAAGFLMFLAWMAES